MLNRTTTVAFLILPPLLLFLAASSSTKYMLYLVLAVSGVIWISLFSNSTIQVLAMLVLLVLVRSIIIYPSKIAGVVVGVSLLFVWVAFLSNTLRWKIYLPPWIKWMIPVFIFLALVSSYIGVLHGNPFEHESSIFQLRVIWAVIFLLFGIQIRQDPNYSQTAIERIFIVILIFVAFLHLLSLFTGINIESIRSDAVVRDIRDVSQNWRYGGVFGNPNVQSAFLLGAMVYAISLFMGSKAVIDKILSSSAFGIGALSIIMSGSRMAMGLLALLLLISFIRYRSEVRKLLAFLGALLICLALAFQYFGEEISNFLTISTERALERGSGDVRFYLWKCTLGYLPEFPLGMGLSHELFMYKTEDCLGHGIGNPHNLLLDFGVRLGVLGLIFAAAAIVSLMAISIKVVLGKRKVEGDNNILFLLMVTLYGISEAYVFQLQKLSLIYAFAIGLAAGAFRPSRKRFLSEPCGLVSK